MLGLFMTSSDPELLLARYERGRLICPEHMVPVIPSLEDAILRELEAFFIIEWAK